MTRGRGFTLVELLLAVTIVAIIAGALYGSFARALDSKGHAEGRAAIYARARLALGQLALELQGVGPRRKGSVGFFRLEPGPTTDEYPTAQLGFVTLARSTAATFPGPREVQYALEPDPAGASRYRWLRRETPALPLSSPDRRLLLAEMPGFVFVPDVAGLSLRAFDGRKWLDHWGTGRTGDQPPSAIAVTLYLADRRGEVRPFSAVIDLPLARRRAPLPPPPLDEVPP